MRREITIENIRANLIKEYGTKPIRKAKISIVAGILIAILCFATGRLSGTVVGVIFAAIGGTELLKANRIRKKIAINTEVSNGLLVLPKYRFYFAKIPFLFPDRD